MENVLQTLAGQYTQQLALMMAAIAVAAFTVSVITEVTKESAFGKDTHGRAGDCAVGCPLSAGLLVVCDQHEGRGRVVGPGLGLVVAFYVASWPCTAGRSWRSCGKIQTSGGSA